MSGPLVVIDTETGGTDPQQHSLLSIALIAYDRPGYSFYEVVKEDPIIATPEALDINKMNLDIIKSTGSTPFYVVSGILNWIERTYGPEHGRITLIGHNVAFDVGFLQRLWRLGKQKNYSDLFSYRAIDTSAIAQFLMLADRLPISTPSSQLLFEYLACTPTVPHNAYHDAAATAIALGRMVEMIKPQRKRWWKWFEKK